MTKLKSVVVGASSALSLFALQAQAALPESVDTAITAAQTDILSMIGKGFVYAGAVVGLMTVLGVFIKIIRKGKG